MSGGRPHHRIGEVGEMWVRPTGSGKFEAGVWRRGLDGRRRQVTATAATKGAAKRKLQSKLDEPLIRSGLGVDRSWTIEELAHHWLRRKSRTGKSGSGQPVKGQTISTYAASVHHIIIPLFGGLRVHELTAAIIEDAFSRTEEGDVSTEGARTVLNQMMKLALRDGAVTHNPMLGVAPSGRTPAAVRAMSLTEAHHLLDLLHPDNRSSGKRASRARLYDLAVFGLGTGARLGELLAIRWCDLDLNDPEPKVHICGTVVEPRRGYVAEHHRQEVTKTEEDRLLALPDAVVQAAKRRREAHPAAEDTDAVFCGAKGPWEWQANIRTQMRVATQGHPLDWVRPHDWRRTVGTHLAYEAGIHAAQLQLGHTTTTGAIRRYIEVRQQRPDHRIHLDVLLDHEVARREL